MSEVSSLTRFIDGEAWFAREQLRKRVSNNDLFKHRYLTTIFHIIEVFTCVLVLSAMGYFLGRAVLTEITYRSRIFTLD